MTLSDRSVSELIKEAREVGDQSLDAIAKETCVSVSYLRAIESGDFDALPAEPFAAGFVKTYARALGLNQKEILALYKAERFPVEENVDEVSVEEMPAATIAVTVDTKPERRMGWLAPTVGALAVAGTWTAFGTSLTGPAMLAENSETSDRIELARFEEVSSQLVALETGASPVETTVLPEPVPVKTEARESNQERDLAPDFAIDRAIAESLDTVEAEAAPIPSRPIFDNAVYADPGEFATHANFRVDAVEDTWIRFANEDGSEVWAGILTAGDSFNPQLNGKVLFSTSNAAGIKIYFDDQEMPSFGGRGEIVKLAELSGAALAD